MMWFNITATLIMKMMFLKKKNCWYIGINDDVYNIIVEKKCSTVAAEVIVYIKKNWMNKRWTKTASNTKDCPSTVTNNI